jgi:hypothetical protein
MYPKSEPRVTLAYRFVLRWTGTTFPLISKCSSLSEVEQRADVSHSMAVKYRNEWMRLNSIHLTPAA